MSPIKYWSSERFLFFLYVSLNCGTISFTKIGVNPACSKPRESPPAPANKSMNVNFGGVAGVSPAEGVAKDGCDGWSEGEASPFVHFKRSF